MISCSDYTLSGLYSQPLLTVPFMFYSFCIACFAGYTPKEASTASVMTTGSFCQIPFPVHSTKMYQGVSLALSYFIIS